MFVSTTLCSIPVQQPMYNPCDQVVTVKYEYPSTKTDIWVVILIQPTVNCFYCLLAKSTIIYKYGPFNLFVRTTL